MCFKELKEFQKLFCRTLHIGFLVLFLNSYGLVSIYLGRTNESKINVHMLHISGHHNTSNNRGQWEGTHSAHGYILNSQCLFLSRPLVSIHGFISHNKEKTRILIVYLQYSHARLQCNAQNWKNEINKLVN